MEANEYRKMYEIEKSYWWFLGKQYLIDTLLRMYMRGSNDCQLMLDVGCGTGVILELMNERGIGCGCEVSEIAIQLLTKRNLKRIAQSDVTHGIPYKNDQFSVITCLDVLEHLENDVWLLKELIRTCKPGGFVFITVPAMGCLWSVHDEALHHKRRYTKRQLVKQIAGLKCHVIKASYFNSSLFLPILALRKLKSLFNRRNTVQSDFFILLPEWLNKGLYLWYSKELSWLRIINFPFGVSVLLVVQKPALTNGNQLK